ncbi:MULTISPECIES: glycosyltransferase family 4 protein [unclassified Bacteroides]|uniref:glycosyltransferase family 4 protein n=1 Tax=unclassified Bacteroides TaxID=2646097 RepID=UPI0004E17888|nr:MULTISPECIES: glycosyltransferase family 4 protein [unclassified Bacteroides]
MSVNNIYICVTPFFPSPTHWQGAYVLDQVKAIKRNSDFEVVVFKTNSLNSKEEDYDIDGVHVYSIRPFLMPSYILNGLTEGLVGTLFVRKLRQIGIDPMDVAFVHCHTASHAAFGFGVRKVNPNAKVLVQFHDLDPYTLRNGKWADKRWNVRYRARKSLEAFERADLLISISTPVQDNLLAFPKARPEEIYPSYLARLEHLKDFPSLKSRKTYILYNGVDTSLFNPEIKKQHDYFRIGCIGNFQELKDHITLIKAFDILIKKGYTNMRLSLLGTGETRPMCENYIREHGLEEYVEWPNEVPHDKLPDYYRSLDLFVLPSVYEGFGCVYTEAYACGVPFMGVYNQGAAEVIAPEERVKWLIQPHDYAGLADLIANYYLHRETQTLCCPIDIIVLIMNFLKFIKNL